VFVFIGLDTFCKTQFCTYAPNLEYTKLATNIYMKMEFYYITQLVACTYKQTWDHIQSTNLQLKIKLARSKEWQDYHTQSQAWFNRK